jgi:DnaJ-class molecular chaperone
MTYCEQTDFDEFAIHLSQNELQQLEQFLIKYNRKGLQNVLRAIQTETAPESNKNFQRIRNIKLCKKCSGSGKIRVGNLRSLDYDLEDCPFCQGEGSIVEKTTICYEVLTSALKSDFAG